MGDIIFHSMRYFIYCRKSSEGEERQVMSLTSQQEALARAFDGKPEIEIVGVYEEAKSAKTPGRPIFAEMLSRIEAGEADGIATWAPDRLARNSIDGGHIIYLLDRGVLRDLKFATYTFENNSQGKFMLGIMFNQSKYYSDALSENVKRGNATKVSRGWRPNRAPIGYLNCPETRTIIPDPDLFPLVRRIFELFLTGAYSPRQIVRIAQDEWGFLTPKKARSGGKPLGRSTIYQLLANPFYAGTFEWAGSTHKGRHEPVVTHLEFARVQQLLARAHSPRPSRRCFAFIGLMVCGSCGKAITAERKINRHGSHYTYYHCAARSRLSRSCPERSAEEAGLERQFSEFLTSITPSPNIAAWVRDRLEVEQAKRAEITNRIAESQTSARAEMTAQMQELTSLRLRRLVDDEEYTRERRRLETALGSLTTAGVPPDSLPLIELLDIAERISNQAIKWFQNAKPETKQKILRITCSNPVLQDRKLSVEAAKPFVIRRDLDCSVPLLGDKDEVRTITREGTRLLKALRELQAEGGVATRLTELKQLQKMCLGKD